MQQTKPIDRSELLPNEADPITKKAETQTSPTSKDGLVSAYKNDSKKSGPYASEPSFAYHSFGCKVNQAEVDEISERLTASGYISQHNIFTAQVVVINTCAVTVQSEQKARRFIREVLRDNSRGRIYVTGCYAENLLATKVIQNERLVCVPNASKAELHKQILEENSHLIKKNAVAARDSESISIRKQRTRPLVKVQDGCDQFCSYCAVPLYRNNLDSRPIEAIKNDISAHIRSGVKEIMVTGVNLSLYANETMDLAGLLNEIGNLPGEYRLRLSSVELNDSTRNLPGRLRPDLKLAKHFHIPLQSGSDRILGAMGRKYTSVQFVDFVSELQRKNPGASFTTDVIVGFPGETAEDADETKQVLIKLNPHRVHIFKYSERSGTQAVELLDKVSEPEKNKRRRALHELSERLRDNLLSEQVGGMVAVVAEDVVTPETQEFHLTSKISAADDERVLMEGYSSEYFRVRFWTNKGSSGMLQNVCITGAEHGKLIGHASHLKS